MNRIEAPSEPVKILIVDDQPDALLAIEAILEQLGQTLVRAQSGKDALRHLLAQEFAVILLDVQMPEMDGYETATLIRERPSSRHTPIIFLTAGYKAESREIRGYDAGAVDYLFKPLDPGILRSKVFVFVEMERRSRLIQRQAADLIQKEAETRELANTRAVLIAELSQQHLDLDQLNKELESFSYSVSHDLRAPLRSIDGFSQALLEDYDGKLDERGKKYLRNVRESAQQMGELISGLLAISRVTRSEIRRERVDLSKLAREVASRLQSADLESTRKVEIAVEEGLFAEGEPRLLANLLENLLGNAWKFTSKRKAARIELGRTQEDGHPAFFVRDNGAGFDMAYAGKLFGAFQRLHSQNEFAGHGIGLATVQRIVRRHGGRIWAEGQIGAGATFYFTLGEGESHGG